MRQVMSCLVAALAAVLLAPAAPAQTPASTFVLAQEASDIPVDSAVKFGQLPNGMRYALLANKLPPGVVSIRMAFDVGSLMETDAEQGLAHFVEHMAFNGSKNVPEGDMVKILERLGLAFGADTNASTSTDFTIYQLDLPQSSDAKLDEALMILREVSSELTFDAAAIDRERGVVLSELRRGESFARRRADAESAFLFPGARINDRMPIGKAEVLTNATRQTFVDFYHRWYRPERAMLVIVGDIDVGAIEQKIVTRFSSWAGVGPAGIEPDSKWSPKPRKSEGMAFEAREGGDSISVFSLRPFIKKPDTVANRRENNLVGLGTSAMSRRFARLANSDKPPFRNAALFTDGDEETGEASMGAVNVTPDGWKPGLEALEREWRRALEFGFTKDEIDDQLANMRTAQENAVKGEGSRTTAALMGGLLGALTDERVFATPTSSLARFNAWAPEVTPAKVTEAFRKKFAVEAPLFFMATTTPRPGVAAEMIAAWEASAKTKVEAPTANAAGKFAYTSFGAPGRVVKDTRRADIDARLITFANNVKLTIKRTTFQKNIALVSLRVGEGQLALPDKPLGLSSIMSAYTAGGLGKHSAVDLNRILTGHNVTASFGAGGTYFGGAYTTRPSDLELQLQVAAAYLTDPGYRYEGERRWRENEILSWPRLEANAPVVLSAKGMRLLAGGDKRVGADKDDGVIYRSYLELAGYLAPQLKRGAIEIGIVGDVDERAAIRAVARTFGALPKREVVKAPPSEDNPIRFRAERTPIVLTHQGEPDQAIAAMFWPINIDPELDPDGARTARMMGAVVSRKLIEEVRETLGATYSPSAGVSLSSVHPDWGYLTTRAEVKPQDVDRVLAAMKTIAASVKAGYISDDEFSRVVTPELEGLPRNAVSNSYWLGMVAQAQSRPELVERSLIPSMEAKLRALTKADIVAAANRWLAGEPQELRIVPEPKP